MCGAHCTVRHILCQALAGKITPAELAGIVAAYLDLYQGGSRDVRVIRKERSRGAQVTRGDSMPSKRITNTKITPKMKLLDVQLQYKEGITLRQYLTKARRKNATPEGPMTWDAIAHAVWTMSGEQVVRESMINYARRMGLAPERVLGESEEIDPESENVLANNAA